MTFITREKIKETYDDYETSKYDLYSEVVDVHVRTAERV